MSCKLKEGRCKGFELGCVHCNEDCEHYEMPILSIGKWYKLYEQTPPVNTEVKLKVVYNGEERIYTDKLIPMLNGTYKWCYCDYDDCDEVVAWRYIYKQ